MAEFDSVILFGAGASAGLTGVVPERPPLGGQLFGRLAHHFPGTWGALPTSLRATFLDDGFEEGMAIIFRHHSRNLPALMQHMSLFFSSFDIVLSAANLNRYCQLAQLVEDQTLENTLFSTLNYDCLFEIACASRRLPFDYFEAPEGAVPIWKLHGSCNFRSAWINRSRGASPSAKTSVPDPIEQMEIADARDVWQAAAGSPPTMSIYLKDGYAQTGHPQIRELQARWGHMVRAAQCVVVVGVRPLPGDDHIWGPLAETPANLIYVGEGAAFRRWAVQYRTGGESDFAGSTFDQGFEAIVDALLQ